MNKYETLIFDLDDTLIDNNESVKYAFMVVLDQLNIKFTNELFKKWLNFDKKYWHIYENEKIIIPNTIKSKENIITYLRANRFLIFFKKLNLSLEDAIDINDLFCKNLGVNIIEIEGASTLLQKLSPNYEILIATNAAKETAHVKLEKANLDTYISSIITPDDVGYSKPKEEFFNYLYKKCENKDKNKMLLTGDSLTTDILGGMNNGIDTCWYNPNNNPIPTKYNPTMSINKLLQLTKKL